MVLHLNLLINDPDNEIMTDAQIHIGLYSMDKLPEYFQLFRRIIQVNNLQGLPSYHLCLTHQESIEVETKI
ncbi:unnamed protein product [Rotaria sordida]|uniref:Uncharacterized protein n=1 Tax=Rotaria sordida TaxID=392033 RepID=A0A815II63_9BILA|nr:unnamed protein product [Rotaria sordida]